MSCKPHYGFIMTAEVGRELASRAPQWLTEEILFIITKAQLRIQGKKCFRFPGFPLSPVQKVPLLDP